MKDFKSKILSAIKTGKVQLGSKKVIDTLLSSETKLVLISHNCPQAEKQRIEYYARLSQTPYKVIAVSSRELGALCARPHSVAALTVIDGGESGIFEAFAD